MKELDGYMQHPEVEMKVSDTCRGIRKVFVTLPYDSMPHTPPAEKETLAGLRDSETVNSHVYRHVLLRLPSCQLDYSCTLIIYSLPVR